MYRTMLSSSLALAMCRGVLPPDLALLSGSTGSLIHSSSRSLVRKESSSAALTSGFARDCSSSSVMATPSGPDNPDAMCSGANLPLSSDSDEDVQAPKFETKRSHDFCLQVLTRNSNTLHA